MMYNKQINATETAKVYTLSVVDDGEITGKPGTILAASREIVLDEHVSSYHDMIQGHGALVSKIRDLPSDWDSSPYRVREGAMFQQCVCASAPTNTVKREEAIWIWERTL